MADPTTSTLPTSGRAYTGWRVVGANSLVWALQSMVWVQGFGNLAVELRDQFGWSKTFLSIVFGATRAEIAVIGPVQGRVIQRRGVARVMRAGALVSVGGFIAVALIQTRIQFLLAMMLLAIGMSLLGFLTISAATVRWFEKRRARALSIQTMGFALGGFAAPIVVVGFQEIGWRWTILIVGGVLSSAAWWAAGISGRTPEETGEPMDGLTEAQAAAQPTAEGITARHLTAGQAIRTHSFWMISFGHAFALLVVVSSMAHLALYLTEDRGYSAGRAALVAGVVPLVQIVGTAAGGYLGDRVNKRMISGIAMQMHGAALLALVWIDAGFAVVIFIVLHGFAWGVRGPQMQAIRADYFGSTSFATIMGWSNIIVTMGAIAGPVLAGTLADATGDYRLGFTILGFAAAFGTVFWVFATPPVDTD